MGTSCSSKMSSSSSAAMHDEIVDFEFHELFSDITDNGLFFGGIHVPEEILTLILSFCEPKDLLRHSLVCKRWCNMIKSFRLWGIIYNRTYSKKKAKKNLPWYVYYAMFTSKFAKNAVKNNCGQENLCYWTIISNLGDGFRVEEEPLGCEPIPANIPDFQGNKSCFVTSYGEANKLQHITFEGANLVHYIVSRFKPPIMLSDWIAGRFDCGGRYHLIGTIFNKHYHQSAGGDDSDLSDHCSSLVGTLHTQEVWKQYEANACCKWIRISLVMKEYASGACGFIFQHIGKDNQFWKGHYGPKMSGAVCRVLFDGDETI